MIRNLIGQSKNLINYFIFGIFLILLLISMELILIGYPILGIVTSIVPITSFLLFYLINRSRIFAWMIVLIQAFGDISISNNDIFTIPKIGTGILFAVLFFSYGISIRRADRKTLIFASIWIVYNGLSLFWSQFPTSSLSRIISLSLLLITTLMVSNYVSRRQDLKGFFEGYVVFSVINSVITLFQAFRVINPIGISNSSFTPLRAEGFLLNPNTNSFQISLGLIIIFLNLLLPQKNRILIKNVLLNILLFLICFLAILSTQSRGGIISLLVGMFSIIIYFLIKLGGFKKIITVIGIMAGFIFGLYAILPAFFLDMLARFVLIPIDKMAGRVDLFKIAWKFFLANPIIGYGPNMFKFLSRPLYGKAAVVHNTYLELLIDGGVINLILFASIIVCALLTFRNIKSIKYYTIKIALVGMLSVIFSMMMTGSIITDKNIWILLGIISGLGVKNFHKNILRFSKNE